ncbi:MAG TPA: hypothetical protein PK605_00475 [Ignavibacteria bacterium]|nr:hypothetical protein [Bacteroidota bacterium]HRE10744.1 hypothetical protein [Ignavibacteria bacterium]HRF66014.1 hypothetical protein [Ignavibacteria bacterium]HRJ02854.1 hypothetical protein [Ignavibacteria bacterium]HRJ84412.1 hypothetical protein [Ignavibacteria bacterium]
MKKILILTLLFLASNVFSQFQYLRIGATKIVDSTGYATFNKSVLLNYNLFLKGQLLLDSLGKGKIFYDGYDVNWYNKKETGSYIFYIGNQVSKFEIRKYSDESYTTYNPIMRVDSNGIDIGIGTGIGNYMIDGTPISGSGTTNLNGYMHKDTAFFHNQHLRTKTFTIYRGTDSDSARFITDGNGDLIIEPVGQSVTLGNATGTGTKDLYIKKLIGETVNATTTYQLNGTNISWGVSTISRTGLTVNSAGSYAKIDSLTLEAGTYLLTYTAQVNFLSGSGSTLTDYSYMDIYDGSSTITNSEIYTGYSYTSAGVNGEFRTYSWNVKVTPVAQTKYYFRMRETSNTGLNVKIKGYAFTAAKVL